MTDIRYPALIFDIWSNLNWRTERQSSTTSCRACETRRCLRSGSFPTLWTISGKPCPVICTILWWRQGYIFLFYFLILKTAFFPPFYFYPFLLYCFPSVAFFTPLKAAEFSLLTIPIPLQGGWGYFTKYITLHEGGWLYLWTGASVEPFPPWSRRAVPHLHQVGSPSSPPSSGAVIRTTRQCAFLIHLDEEKKMILWEFSYRHIE